MDDIIIKKFELADIQYINGYIAPMQLIFEKYINVYEIKSISEVLHDGIEVIFSFKIFFKDDSSINLIYANENALIDERFYPSTDVIERFEGKLVELSKIKLNGYSLVYNNDTNGNRNNIYRVAIYNNDIIEQNAEKIVSLRDELINRINKVLLARYGLNIDPSLSSIEQRLNAIS